jgi:hypothetical protein
MFGSRLKSCTMYLNSQYPLFFISILGGIAFRVSEVHMFL